MFIMTEPTPNPATLKFLPGRAVMTAGTADFTTADAAASSPLARRLFEISGVSGVFLAADFVSVTKADGRDWEIMKPSVLGAIMDHFTSGLPAIDESGTSEIGTSEPESQTVTQIRDLLDTRVRPSVAQDGGDIVYQSFENGVVYLRLQGACAGCPSSTATLKMGIENLLRHYIPEVREVRAVA